MTLRHGDALLLNVEAIAHGLKVLPSSCADANTTRVLGSRRVCIPIRPKADASYEAAHAAFRGRGAA